MKKLIENILGFEVVEITKKDIEDMELVDNSGQYNEEETICVENLSEEGYYYVTVTDERGDWYFQGCYKAL